MMSASVIRLFLADKTHRCGLRFGNSRFIAPFPAPLLRRSISARLYSGLSR
jgi:hypothetical protein